jgi:hypothetical protein
MLEIEASPFLYAITELRSMIVLTRSVTDKSKRVEEGDRTGILKPNAERLAVEMTRIGARSALASVNRLVTALEIKGSDLTYSDIATRLADIELRFSDHLSDIKLFVLHQNEAALFEPADDLLAIAGVPISGFSLAYPKSAFEIEESAKCIALGRFTASAFHSMRALECGIRAMSTGLGIDDPTEPAERNWGYILGEIKRAIDAKWPKAKRLPNTDGAFFESLYATLDAVKNPWRNATMHVDTTYAPHEAVHILRCVSMFMLALSQRCDEEGRPLGHAPAMTAIATG